MLGHHHGPPAAGDTAQPLRLMAGPLLVIRHGETDWNAEGRLQGQRDIPLNARGREQARRNGEALARHLAGLGLEPQRLDFVASPLARARETMEIVRRALGLEPELYRLEPRLREVSFGRFEGLTLAELAERDPQGFSAREADRWHFVPAEGESYAGLAARVGEVLRELDGATLVVAHGGVLRALYRLLLARDVPEVMRMPVSQDHVHLFEGSGLTRL